MTQPSLTVSANVQSAVGNVQRYTKSLETLRKELVAVGNDMRKLSQADQALWNELNKNVQQGLGSKTGKRFKTILDEWGVGDKPIWDVLSRPLSTDPAASERKKRHIAMMLGGGAVSEEVSEEEGGWGARAVRAGGNLLGIRGLTAGAAGMGALGAYAAYKVGATLVGDAKTGANAGQDFLISIDHFSRQIDDSKTTFRELDSIVRKSGDGLRLTYGEDSALMQTYARNGNVHDARQAAAGMRTAAGFARSYGIDPSSTVSNFSQLQFFGRNSMSDRNIAMMIGDTIAQSRMTGRSEEILSALTSAVSQIAQSTGRGPDMASLATMATALNQTGEPGFMGASGISMLMRASNVFAGGGGAGEAGQVFSLMALSRANPNLKGNPFKLDYLRQGGLFASASSLGLGDSTTTNIDAMMRRFGVSAGGKLTLDKMVGSGLINEMQNEFGLSAQQAGAFALAYQRSKFTNVGASMNAAKRLGIDTSKMSPSSIEQFSDIFSGNAEGVRSQLLDRSDIDKSYKRRIQGATPDELATMVAQFGAAPNKGSEIEGQRADIANKQIDMLGGLVTDLKTTIGDVHDKMLDLLSGNVTIPVSVNSGGRGVPPRGPNIGPPQSSGRR